MQLVLGTLSLAALSVIFLLLPLITCVAAAILLTACACYHPSLKHLGWRLDILLLLGASCALAIGIWSYQHFPCGNPRRTLAFTPSLHGPCSHAIHD